MSEAIDLEKEKNFFETRVTEYQNGGALRWDSLEERLDRVRGARRVPNLKQTLLEISNRCSSLPDLSIASPEEILGYDDHGGFS